MVIRSIALVASLAILACTESTSPEAALAGRYSLKTVDGKSLPQLVEEKINARISYTREIVRLNQDRTFTDSIYMSIVAMSGGAPVEGQPPISVVDGNWGLYRVAGDTIYFDSLRNEHYFMVEQIAGGYVRMIQGRRLVYQK